MHPAPTWARQKLSRSAAFAAHMWTPGPKEPTRPPAARHLPRQRSPSTIAARGRLPSGGGQAATTIPAPRAPRKAHPYPLQEPTTESTPTSPGARSPPRRRGENTSRGSTTAAAQHPPAQTKQHQQKNTIHQHLRDEKHHHQGRRAQQTKKKPNLITPVALKCTTATNVAVSDLPARPCAGNYPCDHNFSNLPRLLLGAAGSGPCASDLLLLGLLLPSSRETHSRSADR